MKHRGAKKRLYDNSVINSTETFVSHALNAENARIKFNEVASEKKINFKIRMPIDQYSGPKYTNVQNFK